jgi:hypothetical protein
VPAAPELVAPAHLWVPDHVSSAGGEAAELIESCVNPETGELFVVDPEQRLALDVLLAEKADGRWAAFEAAVIAPRQNIKTFLFKAVALADVYLFGLRLVVWTAHEFNTAMEGFRDVKLIIEANAHLSRRVSRFSEQNGEEGVEFTRGQRLRFKARTKTGGRGLTGDRVILDEAFALQSSHMGSLMPTMSAKSVTGNPQIIYGSSGGLATSGFLRTIRDRGRAGGDPSLAYIEWCAEPGDARCATPNCDHRYGAAGCLLDDEERWARANIALGRRISLQFLASERRSLPPGEFAREVLGWWDDPPDDGGGWQVISEDQWKARLRPDAVAVGALAWSVDAAPDGRSAAIACSNGTYGEVVDHRDGIAWAPARLAQLRADHGWDEVALDATGPAGALISSLDELGVPYRRVTLQEHAQACGGLLEAVVGEGADFVHRGQPPLDAAVQGAERRHVTDVWLWTRSRSSADICPLVAVGLARWWALQGGPSVYEEREMTVLG